LGLPPSAFSRVYFPEIKFVDDVAVFLEGLPAFAAYSKGIATAAVVVIITFFSLVFGELVPKRLGLSNPEKIAKTVAAPNAVDLKNRLSFCMALGEHHYTDHENIQGKDR